ncbi:hypothetical protein BRCON_2070 [Candidatus Sumerlaea chitinivorans]|uniref:Rax2-like C-terminal domain-containing protein n=1 Tax=Sumerlaea chitinivorans TaxID=2250252 RepID=A0A2Z4Y6J1_SUMC1|nr:hypothetical protein BRCON_2070 [Candidatus Sumerlaea chitinivorans]
MQSVGGVNHKRAYWLNLSKIAKTLMAFLLLYSPAVPQGRQAATAGSKTPAQLFHPLQALRVTARPTGLEIYSKTKPLSRAGTRIIPTSLSFHQKGTLVHSTYLPPATVQATANAVLLDRGDLLQEIVHSTTAGIRQDFLVKRLPADLPAADQLVLTLQIRGARITQAFESGLALETPEGKRLSYHSLCVTDARGARLRSHFVCRDSTEVAIVTTLAPGTRFPILIDPTITDADWASLFPLAGANNSVFAAVYDSAGNLYIGGMFTAVGPITANRIAKWNGSTWSPLGIGLPQGGSYVSAMAIDQAGNLYVGGDFSNAGGVSVSHIAKWNGTTWSSIGSTLDGSVTSLAFDPISGNLYVGGYFSWPYSHVAAYNVNTNSWSAVGSGFAGSVTALGVDMNGYLYAAYDDYVYDPDIDDWVFVSNIAKWDGSQWTDIATNLDANVTCFLALPNGDILAGGEFTDLDGIQYLARYDGSSWQAFGNPSDAVYALHRDANGMIYAGGWFYSIGSAAAAGIAQYNGTAWTALGSGLPGGGVTAIATCTTPTRPLIASCDPEYSNPAPYLARWDGSNWAPTYDGLRYGGNLPHVYSFVQDSSGTLYIGGLFSHFGNTQLNNVARWDGSAWQSVGGGVNGYVYGLAISPTTGNLFAIGNFTQAGGNPAQFVARWNGSSWSALGTGLNMEPRALTFDTAGNLYVAGMFTMAGGVPANRIAKWNGSTWSALGSGLTGGTYPTANALAADSSGNIYVGGGFLQAGGNPANRIAKWDGSTWQPLGTGMDDDVYALAVASDGSLYAAGSFSNAGGVSAKGIARWNGTAWSALGSGLTFSSGQGGWCITFDSKHNVYVGGLFSAAGSTPASNIAAWNGTSWFALGSGANFIVRALYINPSTEELYVGGRFTIIGDKAAAGAGRLTQLLPVHLSRFDLE